MNKKQIARFIKKVLPDRGVEIDYFDEKNDGTAKTNTHPPIPVIYFNKRVLRTKACTNNFLKGVILHELGHVVYNHKGWNVRDEYKAQVFAIKTAEKLGMTKILRGLLNSTYRWGNYKIERRLAHLFTIYYYAYLKFLKNKKLVKKYGKIEKGILKDLRNPPS